MIAEQQKLILIADRSELGPSVVAEYNNEELADDSKNEKRLEKAEQSAERKAAKESRKAEEKRVQSSYWKHSFVRHADELPGPEATRNDLLYM